MCTGPLHAAPPSLLRHSRGVLPASTNAVAVLGSVKPIHVQSPAGPRTRVKLRPSSLVRSTGALPPVARTAAVSLAGPIRAELASSVACRALQWAPASLLRHAPAIIPVGQTAHTTWLEAASRSPPRPGVQGLCRRLRVAPWLTLASSTCARGLPAAGVSEIHTAAPCAVRAIPPVEARPSGVADQ